jgi:hypothetical protein
MSDTENGNHQAVRDILEQLDSGEQSAFLMHVVRSMFSPEVWKEVATEATRALPPEAKKDVAAGATQSLPHEVKKDLVVNAVRDLPEEDQKDVAGRTIQELKPKDRLDVFGNPSQVVTDKIWLTIVRTFAAVLLVSAIALLYVSIWPPPGDANPTQVMLPVFTSIAGILAGFISGRASASGSGG